MHAKESAEQLADRVAQRIPVLDRQSDSNTDKFIGGSPEKAVQSLFTDARPARAAQQLVNAAKNDGTGKALDGVKRAFVDNIINGATSVRSGQEALGADVIIAALNDPKKAAALRRVFTPAEIGRFRRIAFELSKAEQAQGATPNIAVSLSGAKVNKVLEFVARVIAANHGAGLGNNGASLQTAQMASSRIRDMLAGLTADRASRLMAEAVTDPELMRSLLTDASAPKVDERVINRLILYLAGRLTAIGA